MAYKPAGTQDIKRGPYVNRAGLLVVPLAPGMQIYPWEILGFRYSDPLRAMVRSVTKPRNGQYYKPNSWLLAAKEKYAQAFPQWTQIAPDWRDAFVVEFQAPYGPERALILWRAYGGDREARAAFHEGLPFYAFAGAIKNEFNVQDMHTRRALQSLARRRWAMFEEEES